MKVFLDTNVLVSAFTTRGLCADVLRLVLSKHEFVTAEIVLTELRRVLGSKFGMPGSEIDAIEDFLREYPVEPKPSSPSAVGVRDPDDARVLASASAVGAGILVTGDAAVLEVATEVPELTIKSPRSFWEIHR